MPKIFNQIMNIRKEIFSMQTEKVMTTPTSLTLINKINENDIATTNKRLRVKLSKTHYNQIVTIIVMETWLSE